MLEPLNTFLLSNNTHKRLILELSQSWNIIKLNVCTMHGNELNWNASSVHFCCFVNSFKRSCHKPAQSINQSNVLSQWDQSSTGNTQTCKHSNTKLIKSIDKKSILNKNVIVKPCSRLSTARRPYLCATFCESRPTGSSSPMHTKNPYVTLTLTDGGGIKQQNCQAFLKAKYHLWVATVSCIQRTHKNPCELDL